MSKYIYSVCDIQAGCNSIYSVMAHNITECQEKIMQNIIEDYDFDDNFTYPEFVQFLDDHDILISEIEDIETL